MKKTRWDGAKLNRVIRDAGRKALRTMGEKILTESKREVPVLTGALRRSGTVTEGALPDLDEIYEGAKSVEEGGGEQDFSKAYPKPMGKDDLVYISFNTPYALLQHEELGFNHPRGGKALYLKDPLNRNAEKTIQYVQLRVSKALRESK